MNKKERNQIIANKYESGFSVESIANDHELSIGTVKNIVAGSGASRKPLQEMRDAKIGQMSRQNCKIAEIADQFHLSIGRVNAIVARTKKENTMAQKNQPGEPG